MVDTVIGAHHVEHQSRRLTAVGVGARDDHHAAVLLDEHPARSPTVGAPRNVGLDQPQPLTAKVGVGVGIWIRQRPDEALDVGRGPGPVDDAVAVGALVEERALAQILRRPASRCRIPVRPAPPRRTSGTRSRVASTRLVPVLVGVISTARCTRTSPVSSSASIRCAVRPVGLAPLISDQITGENPVNLGSSESCRLRSSFLPPPARYVLLG